MRGKRKDDHSGHLLLALPEGRTRDLDPEAGGDASGKVKKTSKLGRIAAFQEKLQARSNAAGVGKKGRGGGAKGQGEKGRGQKGQRGAMEGGKGKHAGQHGSERGSQHVSDGGGKHGERRAHSAAAGPSGEGEPSRASEGGKKRVRTRDRKAARLAAEAAKAEAAARPAPQVQRVAGTSKLRPAAREFLEEKKQRKKNRSKGARREAAIEEAGLHDLYKKDHVAFGEVVHLPPQLNKSARIEARKRSFTPAKAADTDEMEVIRESLIAAYRAKKSATGAVQQTSRAALTTLKAAVGPKI